MDPNTSHDLPLADDVAELKREAQKAVDRNIRARQELADSNAELDAVEARIAGGAQDALDFVRAYRNPTRLNPDVAIAPDVAAPAPEVEPPVFTDVSSTVLTPSSTSGGFADAGVAEGLTLPPEA